MISKPQQDLSTDNNNPEPVTDHSNSAQFYYQQARQKVQQGQLQAAIPDYKKTLERDAQHLIAYQELGNVLLQLKRPKEAINYYYQALQLQSNSSLVYHHLGDAFSQLEQWEKAIAAYRKAIELEPNYFWSHQNLADILLKLEQWSEAITAYQQAIQLQSDFSWSHHNLGKAYLMLKQWQAAVQACQTAIRLNPEFHWSYYNLAEAFFHLQQWDEAVATYSQALELDQNLPEAQERLNYAKHQSIKSKLELVQSHYLKAIEQDSENPTLYQKALEVQPNNATLYVGLGNALKIQGEFKQAITAYQQAIALDSENVAAYLQLAEALKIVGDSEKSLENQFKAYTLEPTQFSVEQHYNLGDRLKEVGQLEQAEICYQLYNPLISRQDRENFALENMRPHSENDEEKESEQLVDTVKSYMEKGENFIRGEQWEQALNCYQNIVDLQPKNWFAHHKLGDIFLCLSKYNNAINCYQNCLKLKPDFDWSYYNIGVAELRLRNPKKAFISYQKLTEINPNFWHLNTVDYQVQHEIGDFWFEDEKNWENALICYRRAIVLNSESCWSYCNLGRVLQHTNQYEEAIAALNQALEIDSSFLWGYYFLGEVLLEIENLNEALIAYRKTIEIDSSFEMGRRKLELVLAKLESNQKSPEPLIVDSDKSYEAKISLEKLYILEAHKYDPTGLGIVARQCSYLGETLKDSRKVTGKVLVPGRPDTHYQLVNSKNTNYLWTTFESDQLPSSWVENINHNFTEVFVPHIAILRVFRNSGVQCPITVIPQGYPQRYRTQPIRKQPNQLKLGILGGANRRKNFAKVVGAVQQLRQQGRDIELMIHCPWLTEAERHWKHLPGIKLTEGDLSNDQLNQWYSELDAYIFPSSGEGWSFTPRESMSLGIPTIITDIAVHQELVESRFFLNICSGDWEPAYHEFLERTCGQWKHYSVEKIAHAIIQIMDNYTDWYDKAQQGQEWIKQQWRWEEIEQKLLSAIFPQHLLFCPTQYQNCGIHTYSQALVDHSSQTKYVGSYEHLQQLLTREPIQSIQVQYESSIFDNQELYYHANDWNCYKQITLHSVVKGSRDATFKGLLTTFDKIFVLNQEALSEVSDAQYIPHGSKLPVTPSFLSKANSKTVATFGFIHEDKGYPYLLESTRNLGLKWRIIGKVKRDLPQRLETWQQYIQGHDHVEHFDGFFPEVQILHLLSEAGVIIFYHKNSNYLYQSGSVLTAARCQRPIICATTTPLKSFHGCVHYVPYGDLDALMTGIQLVLENQNYGDSLVRAMNRYLEMNHWDIIAKKMLPQTQFKKNTTFYPNVSYGNRLREFASVKTNVRRIAVIGNYLPRKCGIATFTTDLCNALSQAHQRVKVMALPVNDIPAGYAYPDIVRYEIEQHSLESYRDAAQFINQSEIDIVCLQHEYGIFGGSTGKHILALLEKLSVPVVTTLHTVLADPDPEQRFVIKELERLCSKLVVMSQRGQQFLQKIFGVPQHKIEQIFHGVHDVPFTEPDLFKEQLGFQGKNVILSFGLLGRSKGVEYSIQALPEIIKQFPDTVYVYVGATHPHVLQHEGESYRDSLQQLATDLGVIQNVKFVNQFLELDDLIQYIGAADIYLTPYQNPAQITSGTLAYTASAGKAVISTPYWHAEELLADGRGILVPFQNSESISKEAIRLLANKDELNGIRLRAYRYGRQMTWSAVAQQYLKLFDEVASTPASIKLP